MIEKFFTLCKLGIKYLHRYRRRYGFLLTALIFGFAVVTFITSQKDGMYESVYFTAQSHYAGDIVAVSHNSHSFHSNHMGQKEISAILDAAENAEINPQHTVFRTLVQEDGIIHFNGFAVQLKYLIGCDWEKESHLFGRMAFDGNPEPLTGDDGIVLSLPVANQMGARMGDSIILELDTYWGQKNTGLFIVKGIVRDSSIFGYYKAYISRLSLNRLLLYDDNDCSSIGFFLEAPAAAEQKRQLLYNAMNTSVQNTSVQDTGVQIGPLAHGRSDMDLERSQPREGIRIYLYTLPVYLSEISDLLDAMNIITYFLYGMMLLIILVSAAVTYRLILHERVREFGIMRALGFYGSDLRLILWTEVIALGFFSLIAGFILACILNWAVSLLTFSWFPSFEIFMKNGRLSALHLPETTLINVILIFFVLIAMALFPSFRASRKNLCGLLSGEPL